MTKQRLIDWNNVITSQGRLAAIRSWEGQKMGSPLEPQEETSPGDFDFKSVGLTSNLWGPSH